MTYPPPGGYPGAPNPGYPDPNSGQPGYGYPSYPPAGQASAPPGYPTSGQPGYGPAYPDPNTGQPGYGYPSYPPAGQASAPPGYPASGQPGYGPGYPQQPDYGQNPYPYQQPNPYQTKIRPGAVTVACVLMMVLPVLSLINFIVSIAASSAMKDNLRTLYLNAGISQDSADTALSGAGVSSGYTGVPLLIGAIIIGVLAIFNLRGVNGTRIATWVLLGLGIAGGLCGGIALGGLQATLSSLSSVNQRTVSVDSIVPGWYYGWGYLNVVVTIALDATVIVLLARPAANAYFRKY